MTDLSPLRLSRSASQAPRGPALHLVGEVAFARARVHELCGSARRSLAVMLAGAGQGPLIWIAPAWEAARLFPDGMQRWCDPARLLEVRPTRQPDLLWAMEEVLRAGLGGVAVLELPQAPSLTMVRRLHLAAQAGQEATGQAALPLLLSAGAGMAPGVETRWHIAPQPGPGPESWRIERCRARMAPPRAWRLVDAADGLKLHPPQAEGAPGDLLALSGQSQACAAGKRGANTPEGD